MHVCLRLVQLLKGDLMLLSEVRQRLRLRGFGAGDAQRLVEGLLVARVATILLLEVAWAPDRLQVAAIELIEDETLGLEHRFAQKLRILEVLPRQVVRDGVESHGR